MMREPAAVVRQTPLGKSPLRILSDADATFDKLGVESVPHTMLFDASGKLAESIGGYDVEALGRMERRIRGG